jgi:hypothetical protein
MKTMLANPSKVAIFGLLLALPFMCLFSFLMQGIEISYGPLDLLLTAEGSRLGSFIFLGALLLSLLGLKISLRPVLRSVRTENNITRNPANLLVAGTILFFILAMVGAIIVDQYPCWTGVPNCD